jgi:hypothetical protein
MFITREFIGYWIFRATRLPETAAQVRIGPKTRGCEPVIVTEMGEK